MTVPGIFAAENLRTARISVNPRDLSTSLASLKGTPMTLGSVTIFGAIGVSETVDVALGGDEGP